MAAIADWLAREFDLPRVSELPKIAFVSSSELTRKRYRVIRADATLLGYVLLNLGAQAREAMPYGGTLNIETALLDVDASATTHSDLRDWPASPSAASSTR